MFSIWQLSSYAGAPDDGEHEVGVRFQCRSHPELVEQISPISMPYPDKAHLMADALQALEEKFGSITPSAYDDGRNGPGGAFIVVVRHRVALYPKKEPERRLEPEPRAQSDASDPRFTVRDEGCGI